MDVAAPQKLWKIYNLRTQDAMNMKLTTIVYLNYTFHVKKKYVWLGGRGRTWLKNFSKKKIFLWSNFLTFLEYIKNRNIYDFLIWIQ